MKEISRRDFLKGSVAGALGLAAANFVLPSAIAFADGNSYTATAQGFAGPVTVTATIDGDKITAVTAEGPNETPDRGGVACATIPVRIVEANSVAVDGVAGATMTSNAIFTAMDQILEQAGLSEGAGSVAMKPGIYVGEGKGFDWIEPVRVKIEVDETSLLSVEVIELELNREEPVIQKAAVDLMIPRMIENQSVTVDAITGATGVSTGIKLATRDALIKALVAGGSSQKAISHFEKEVEKKTDTVELSYKIVVAGMGGAMDLCVGCPEVIITMLLSYFSLVFGELVPKQIALRYTSFVALNSAIPIHWLLRIASQILTIRAPSRKVGYSAGSPACADTWSDALAARSEA